MATVEGNLEALLEAAEQLVPPVRTGQKASKNQDEVGAPFVTTTYFLRNSYETETTAPGWCYGFILTPSIAGSGSELVPTIDGSETKFYASFGAASTANETILTPGQAFLFQRGARRVFLRSNVAEPYRVGCSVTWIMDRYASIGSGGPGSPVAVKGWAGLYENTTAAGTDGLEKAFGGASYLAIGLTNSTNQTVTYRLAFGPGQFDLDTGTLTAGSSILLSYGVGVGLLGNANLGGHGFVLPEVVTFYATCATPGSATGNIIVRSRAY